VGDEDYDFDEATQIRHFSSQATSILLASLCTEEYNKVQGFKNAKKIWDVLKTTHEGDEVTKITKCETIEEELGRFVLNKGEEPQAMYNRLKTMVSQVRNLGSTKWDDHEMVKVILRSLVFHNPTQVQLICGDPRYKQMSPGEVIGKFVSFELMIKDCKHIVNLEQLHPWCNPLHSRQRKKIRKSLHQIGSQLTPLSLTTRKWLLSSRGSGKCSSKERGKTTNPVQIRFAIGVVSLVIKLLNIHIQVTVIGTTARKGRRRWRRRDTTTRRRVARRTWNGNETLTRAPPTPPTRTPTTSLSTKAFSSATLATNTSSLKDRKKKKVHSRDTPKYTTSDDEGSSRENDDDLTSLFANLTKEQKKKINEFIETINEKDDILECQDDLLAKENKKNVKLKDAYSLEVEKCQNLTKELDIWNDSISCLRTENASLIAKIEELNTCKASTSIEHVTICTRCRDINVDAMNDHLAIIKEQNDHIVKLNAKIAKHELDNEKIKFVCSMLYNGRRPDIKDGIGFQ
jgi:hypothetical protein